MTKYLKGFLPVSYTFLLLTVAIAIYQYLAMRHNIPVIDEAWAYFEPAYYIFENSLPDILRDPNLMDSLYGHAPFYPLLMASWFSTFGLTTASLRLFAVLLTSLLLLMACRKNKDPLIKIILVSFVAFHPTFWGFYTALHSDVLCGILVLGIYFLIERESYWALGLALLLSFTRENGIFLCFGMTGMYFIGRKSFPLKFRISLLSFMMTGVWFLILLVVQGSIFTLYIEPGTMDFDLKKYGYNLYENSFYVLLPIFVLWFNFKEQMTKNESLSVLIVSLSSVLPIVLITSAIPRYQIPLLGLIAVLILRNKQVSLKKFLIVMFQILLFFGLVPYKNLYTGYPPNDYTLDYLRQISDLEGTVASHGFRASFIDCPNLRRLPLVKKYTQRITEGGRIGLWKQYVEKSWNYKVVKEFPFAPDYYVIKNNPTTIQVFDKGVQKYDTVYKVIKQNKYHIVYKKSD